MFFLTHGVVSALRYTDDKAVVASTQKELQNLKKIWNEDQC